MHVEKADFLSKGAVNLDGDTAFSYNSDCMNG